jgi:hypothetical protein
MPGPGWYSDPQDAAQVRWFDGDDWTEHRQPSIPTPAAVAANGSGDLSRLSGAPYDPYAERDDFTAPAESSAAISPPTATEVTQVTDLTGLTGLTEVSDATAAGGALGPQLGNGAVTVVSPAGASGPIPRGTHASGTRRPIDKRLLLIGGLVLVLVAGLVTGGFLLFGGDSHNSFTYQGKTISDAAATLQQAEGHLTSLVDARHGNQNSSTRCYYAVPLDPASGKKTDIDQHLRCGPVLFVDGNADQAYLSYGFTAAARGGSVVLTPATTPQSNTPAVVPAGFTLKRPDGKTPPSGNADLTAPTPPAAGPNTLAAAPVTQPAGTKPITAIIGAYSGGITITDIGRINRYGTGDNAHSAPAGQRLYAFKLGPAAANDGTVKELTASTTIVVDGAPGRSVPGTTAQQAVVIAVPSATKTLDVVLTDGGLTQTFSLLTGKPGAGNIVVLARSHRGDAVNEPGSTTFTYSAKVVFADKSTGTTQSANIQLNGATLAYQDPAYKISTPSGVDKAYLIPDLTYTGSHDNGPYGLNTSLLTFTPTGGTAIPAKNVSSDPTTLRNVFEVPAGVTTGTITIGGTATEMFAGTTTTYTLTVSPPVNFPVSFAAG